MTLAAGDADKVENLTQKTSKTIFTHEGVNHSMSTGTITTQDRTTIFYKDWGTGQPVVFSHGWPLNADAWDDQLNFVASHGYRAVAHDRRGHGRSGQPWN